MPKWKIKFPYFIYFLYLPTVDLRPEPLKRIKREKFLLSKFLNLLF